MNAHDIIHSYYQQHQRNLTIPLMLSGTTIGLFLFSAFTFPVANQFLNQYFPKDISSAARVSSIGTPLADGELSFEGPLSPTYLDKVTLIGKKAANSTLWINGAQLTSANAASTDWTTQRTLQLGTNALIVEVKSNGQTTARISYQIKRYAPGDVSGDAIIDVNDLSIVASHYKKTGVKHEPTTQESLRLSDVNMDGSVRIHDLGVVAHNYGKQFTYGNEALPTPTQPAITITPSPTTTGAPQNTPTQSPTITTPPTTSGSNSQAMGKWSPSRFDTCTKDIHDKYFVVGPDGKKYPTWHPPVDSTGCTFGHEHGRNPSAYQYFDEIKKHFAYDADQNGLISASELATAGIPFGYVNEQLDAYNATSGHTNHGMRHEDHVGHKVEFANGEGDIGDGTDPFDTNKSGGVVVPVKNSSGGSKWNQSGVRCYHFHKIHQGVSTPDALTNNIHEAIMHQKCTSTINQFAPSTTILSGLITFGAPGEFTRFCPDNRTQPVVLGTTDMNRNFPGTRGNGERNIITRDCVESTVLVPDGQFSSFPYELWSGGLSIKNTQGTAIASNGGGWEVLDAIRYYNPNTANKISYSASWCYESIGNRRTRGGTCDWMTDYGRITDITWDDPRSGYKGLHRGQYVQAHQINNSNGAEYWYSDPFGGKAQTTPFSGSIRQYISKVNANTNGLPTDPRIIMRNHEDGNNSVHAPN